MTWWTPVLYFEDKSSSVDSSGSDGTSSSQDWHFCVTYEGLDTYTLYGYRNSTNQTWNLTFLTRQSLAQFLLTTLSRTSNFTTSLYVVDEESLWRDNFQNYYSAWQQENEFYSREVDWDHHTFDSIMDHLLLLRDLRCN